MSRGPYKRDTTAALLQAVLDDLQSDKVAANRRGLRRLLKGNPDSLIAIAPSVFKDVDAASDTEIRQWRDEVLGFLRSVALANQTRGKRRRK